MIKASDCRQQYFISINAAVVLCDLIDQQNAVDEQHSENSKNNSKSNVTQQSLLQGALFHLGQGLRSLCLAYASDDLRETLAKEANLIACLEQLETLHVRSTELALLLRSLHDAGLDRLKVVYQHLFAMPQSFVFPSAANRNNVGLIAVDAGTDSSPLTLDAKLCRYWIDRLREADELAISLSVEC